jgi:hypothetical protein
MLVDSDCTTKCYISEGRPLLWEPLFAMLMPVAALMEHCRMTDGLTNNVMDCITINIADETSNNKCYLEFYSIGSE